MPNFQKIYDYITETPENTNPIILKELIEKEYGSSMNFGNIYKYISKALNKINPNILKQLIAKGYINPVLPAQTTTITKDGAELYIEIPDGALSTGSTMRAEFIDIHVAQDAFDNSIHDRGEIIVAAYIQFYNSSGIAITPSSAVTLIFSKDGIADASEIKMVKFSGDESALISGEYQASYDEDIYTSGNTVTASTNGGYTYAVLGE